MLSEKMCSKRPIGIISTVTHTISEKLQRHRQPCFPSEVKNIFNACHRKLATNKKAFEIIKCPGKADKI